MDLAAILQAKKNKLYAIKSHDNLTIKDVDLTKRMVTGMFNTALVYDSDGDVIMPGANNKSISERGPNSNATQKIKHLMFHDWSMLPGKIKVLEEKTIEVNSKPVTGTYFETKMSNSTLGNDSLINYQEGVYDNHSEGFQYVNGEYCEAGSDLWNKTIPLLTNPQDAVDAGFMFLWNELKMYEGSTVAFGANALTPFLGVKSGNKDALIIKTLQRIDLLTKNVKTGTQSDETLQAFEMQALQLKQIINELFLTEPSAKDIILKKQNDRIIEDTKNKKSLNVSQLINIF